MINGEETFLHFDILPILWRYNGAMWDGVIKYDGEKTIVLQRLDRDSAETPEDNLIYLTPGQVKYIYFWLEARGAFDG